MATSAKPRSSQADLEKEANSDKQRQPYGTHHALNRLGSRALRVALTGVQCQDGSSRARARNIARMAALKCRLAPKDVYWSRIGATKWLTNERCRMW